MALALGLGLCALAAAGPALAFAEAGCPNESSPGFRSYLPECRAYEMVTPPFKDGFPVRRNQGQFAISEDGSRLIGLSLGVLAGSEDDEAYELGGTFGALYELSRTASGWAPAALDPPASVYSRPNFRLASGDLGRSLWEMTERETSQTSFYVREAAPGGGGRFVRVEPPAGVTFEHAVAVGGSRGDAGEPWVVVLEASGGGLYAYDTASASATLVSGCTNARLGSGAGHSAYDAVSQSGERVFYSCGAGASEAVLAWTGGGEPVKISEPSTGDCAECVETSVSGAEFLGASADGSKVFFATGQELLPGMKGRNIYEYDFDAQAGHRVTPVSAGSARADVLGVARISQDGARVYFVAEGALTGANAEGRSPEQGERNLYVYDALTGRTAFVAPLQSHSQEAAIAPRCTPTPSEAQQAQRLNEAQQAQNEAQANGEPARQAEAAEAYERLAPEVSANDAGISACEAVAGEDQIWRAQDSRAVETTPDGRFLLFASVAALTEGDASTVQQLFEYDAQSERLARVSIGQEGSYNGDGNTDDFRYAPSMLRPVYSNGGGAVVGPATASSSLSLADNGTVLFTSRLALVPQASSGHPLASLGDPNVYEYREGEVRLISDGHDTSIFEKEAVVSLLGVDATGLDVFFVTSDELVPQAQGGQQGWYDARIDGGFPAPLSSGCSPDACQGPFATAPALPSPSGSATVPGGENLPHPDGSKPASKPKPLTRAQKLAKALKACRKDGSKNKRVVCERRAHKQYGASTKAKRSAHRHRKAG